MQEASEHGNYTQIDITKLEFLLKANNVDNAPLNSTWAFKFKLSEEVGKVLILTKVEAGLKIVTEVFEMVYTI